MIRIARNPMGSGTNVIRLLLIFCCLVSCNSSSKSELLSIEKENGELIVKFDLDSLLLKESFVDSGIKIPSEKDLIDEYIFIESNFHLKKREYFSLDFKCVQTENFLDDGMKEIFVFQKKSTFTKFYTISKNGSIYYKTEYDDSGNVVKKEMKFIFDFISCDEKELCIKVTQPAYKIFNSTFKFYADVQYSEEDEFKLRDITTDTIKGIGNICFDYIPNKETVIIAGEFYHFDKNDKVKLFNVSHELIVPEKCKL